MADKSTDVCVFPKCRSESVLIWLDKPLCDKHWNWVCDKGLQKSYKKLNVASHFRTTPYFPSMPIEGPKVASVDSFEKEKLSEKPKKQAYTKEIDQELLKLKSQGLSIPEIAKLINRSVASVGYRLYRVLSK